MVTLAAHILQTKATKFDPSKFKDEHELALKKLVQRKAKDQKIEAPEPSRGPENVVNLMDALRQSLAKPGKPPSAGRDSQAQSSMARASYAASAISFRPPMCHACTVSTGHTAPLPLSTWDRDTLRAIAVAYCIAHLVPGIRPRACR
jgi:hypothetical protein